MKKGILLVYFRKVEIVFPQQACLYLLFIVYLGKLKLVVSTLSRNQMSTVSDP